jgi:hypothetical protein
MPYMDVAGRKIQYRNVADLNAKLVALLESVHAKRVTIGQAFESLRKQEDSIRRLLGGVVPAETNGTASGNGSDAR